MPSAVLSRELPGRLTASVDRGQVLTVVTARIGVGLSILTGGMCPMVVCVAPGRSVRRVPAVPSRELPALLAGVAAVQQAARLRLRQSHGTAAGDGRAGCRPPALKIGRSRMPRSTGYGLG